VERYSNTDHPKTDDFKTAAALVAANFFYGTNVIAVKLVSPSLISPLGLSFARMFVSALVLLTIPIFIKPKERILRSDYPLLILAGFLGITCNQILSIMGIASTNPINASLLNMATPIIVTLLATIFIKEKFGMNNLIGLLLGLAGAIILISGRKSTIGNNEASIRGDLFVLLASVCYSTYLILMRRISTRYTPLTILRFVFLFGTVFSIPFCLEGFMDAAWDKFNGTSWYAIFHVIILGTLLSNILMNWGVMKWGPSKTGSFVYFQPLFGTLGAVMLMGEQFTSLKIAAGLLIIAGVWITSRKSKKTSS